MRSWERNTHYYADTLASSLAAQAIFDYAAETDRARRVLSKLRQVPRLMQAARENIKDPPGIFVKVGLDTWRGTMTFIELDLPRAFSAVDDMHLLGDLADACSEAVQTIGATSTTSRTTSVRRRRAPSASAGIDSSRSCVTTRASRCRSIGCWRSPRASFKRRRKNSARPPAA